MSNNNEISPVDKQTSGNINRAGFPPAGKIFLKFGTAAAIGLTPAMRAKVASSTSPTTAEGMNASE